MTEEAHPEAAVILAQAGWKPHDRWGVYTRGTLVMGFSPDGQNFDVKNWGLDVHGSDYPDDPVEAAQWLVRLRAKPLEEPPEAVESLEHESDGETGEASAERAVDEADGNDGHPIPEEPWASAAGDDTGGGHVPDPIDAESVGVSNAEFYEALDAIRGDLAEALDADFTIEDFGAESEELEDPADLPLIEGADLEPEEIEAAPDGPIAYGASTIDGLIREKLGRVSQIARELKAVQQDGWTVEEYAYLQNLIVRMDRGEAPDDQASRERFLAIAARSQAMSRIDAVRDRKEGELEEIGQRRDFDAAVYYEPEAGWP